MLDKIGAGWGQAQIAPCKFGTGLERPRFLPKKQFMNWADTPKVYRH